MRNGVKRLDWYPMGPSPNLAELLLCCQAERQDVKNKQKQKNLCPRLRLLVLSASLTCSDTHVNTLQYAAMMDTAHLKIHVSFGYSPCSVSRPIVIVQNTEIQLV